jgi:hypothetical protein
MVSVTARRARQTPSMLSHCNMNFWEDIREVLLDPDPTSWELETIRRWLRDQVETEMRKRLFRRSAAKLVKRACLLTPRLVWKLPYSRGIPEKRHHRLITAILIPHEMRLLEAELVILAFQDGL